MDGRESLHIYGRSPEWRQFPEPLTVLYNFQFRGFDGNSRVIDYPDWQRNLESMPYVF